MTSSTPTSAPEPGRLLTLRDYERAALRVLPRMVADYFRSGADEERTLRANVRAFRRARLAPRVLVDVSSCDPSIELLGRRLALPVLVAPMAYQKLAHADGEPATARATAAAGTIFVASTLSTVTMEEIAAAAPQAPRWFQLYAHRDRGITQALVERAAAAGFTGLVVTVDAPVLGRRLSDVRNAFALPEGFEMANLREAPGAPGDGSQLASHFAARHDATLSWRDLDWLRGMARLPLILKGILRADDAARAASAGVDAVVVSNHGGRQLDGVAATLDALPPVVAAVADRCPVLLDGGVRWGTDVLKALALGARAVLVGRPVLWGLAVAGEAGAADILAILRDELVRAMMLAGCPTVASITRDLVA